MAFRTEENLRRTHLALLALSIAWDGGVSPLASAVCLLGFSVLLFAGATIPFRRPLLHRLRTGALLIALAVAALAVVQVWWLSSGDGAHPSWRNLNEAFGEIGGTRAAMRMQPIWEIPGTILPFVAFAAAVPLYRTARAVQSAWTTFASIGAVFALWGIAQVTLFPEWNFGRQIYVGSLTGTYVNRNAAAALLVMTSLATAALALRLLDRLDPRHLTRLFLNIARPGSTDRRLGVLLALLLLQVTALFLTRSRAGTGVGLLALGLLFASRLPRFFADGGRRLPRVAATAAVVLFGALLFLLTARVAHRLDIQGLDDHRWCVWPSMWQMAVDALPWGVGLGGVVSAFSAYRRPECGLAGIWDNAHDGYIQGLATMGLLFPVLLVAVVALLLPPLLRGRRRGGSPGLFATTALIALAAMALHSLVDFPLEIPADAALLGLLCLTAVAAATEGRRPGGERRRSAERPDDRRPSGAPAATPHRRRSATAAQPHRHG